MRREKLRYKPKLGAAREKYKHKLHKADVPAPRPLPPHFHQHATIGLMSADNPGGPVHPGYRGGHSVLAKYLTDIGLKYTETNGQYQNVPERSFIIHDPTIHQMQELGSKFGQEMVVFSKGPSDHKAIYTHGIHKGKYRPFSGKYEIFDTPPKDDYTRFPGHGFLRLHFDWDNNPIDLETPTGNPPPTPGAKEHVDGMDNVQPEHAPGDADDRAGVQEPGHPIKKHLVGTGGPVHVPWPGAYPWHDSHTSHYATVSPILKNDPQEHPHTGGPPQENPHINEQAAGKGVKTYAQFATPYGTVTPGTKTNLLHYRYEGKAKEIDKLIADHGYQSYFAGGKYGKPDLANRNYNTKFLQIYDPTPSSGGDFGNEEYTTNWRKTHELAHALTYPQINAKYGEGRRIGKLGVHRTLREALRAVEWEHMVVHKQRELSAQIGVHISDEDFNREHSTVMHDAVHRAVTGQFSEPSQEGFSPHAHAVPLEQSLNMVRAEAQKLGLPDSESLIRKNASNLETMDIPLPTKTIPISEAKKVLAKAIQNRVETYKTKLTSFRERELRKSAGTAAPAPKPSTFQVTVPDLANCPRCNRPDAPGSCLCLVKGEGAAPKLFAGADQSGKKQPPLFTSAKKGDAVLDKDENPLFNGSTKTGKKTPSLFERAHGGEDVFKDEPDMNLFHGSENKGTQEPELFSGAHKGAGPLGKEEPKVSQIGSQNPKKQDEGMRKEPCTGCGAPTVTIGPKHSIVCNKCSGKKTVKKSESPIFKAEALNLCKGCMKSHSGPRCKPDPKVVKSDADGFNIDTRPADRKVGVMPHDKKSKEIDTEAGSGGKLGKEELEKAKYGSPDCPACGGEGGYLGALGTRHHFRCRGCGMDFSHQETDKKKGKKGPAEEPGKKLGKADTVPTAKPPSGVNPTATPMSKPGAVGQAPAQAPKPMLPPAGVANIAKPPTLPGAHLFAPKVAPAAAPLKPALK